MYLNSQGYLIPKAGGTIQFRLLSEGGAPLKLTSVTCTNSSVNSSITYDKAKYIFSATFPANTTTSTKTFTFTSNFTLKEKNYQNKFEVEQTGNSSYLYSDGFYTPFIEQINADFYSSFGSTIGGVDITTTEENNGSISTAQYTAPHYRSVSDYFEAARANEISNGWVYVDGKWDSSTTPSYNTANGYLYNFMWVDEGTHSPSIEFDALYGPGFQAYTSNPTDAQKNTYKTIGFYHNAFSSSATTVVRGAASFVKATNTTIYDVTSNPSGTLTVDQPWIIDYYAPVSNPSVTSLGNNKYRFSKTYEPTNKVLIRIVTIKNSDDSYEAEKVFRQVPADSITITNTELVLPNTEGTQTATFGNYSNFTPDSSYFSVEFPNGKPNWIAMPTITGSYGSLILNANVASNVNGTTRSTNAIIHCLDKPVNVTITQKGGEGSISTDINSIVVPAQTTDPIIPDRHRDVIVYSENISGDITPTISGQVTGTFEWYEYNGDNYLLFHPTDNMTGNTITGTVTLTGTDNLGRTVTASYTVTQKSYNPTMKWYYDDGTFISDTALIRQYETPFKLRVVLQGVTSASDFAPRSSFNNSFINTYYRSSTTTRESYGYSFSIETNNNNTYTPSDRAMFTPATIETEFGKNPWQQGYGVNLDAVIYLKKCGTPGSISVSESSKTVEGTSGSLSFTYSPDSHMTTPLTVTHSGTMNITSFNSTSSTIDLSYGENTGIADKQEVITISGVDYQGLTINRTITINQKVLTYLEFIDTEKYIEPDTTTVTFRLRDYNMSNLTASFSGNVGIVSHSFTATAEGHLLTITTSNNSNQYNRTSTITVSGRDYYGNQKSVRATLTKYGLDGTIVLDPTSRTIPKTGSTFIIGVNTSGITTSTITASSTGNVGISELVWNSSKTQLTVAYTTNTGSSDKTGSIIITGTDYKGETITATCSITQVTADSSLSISPHQLIVNRENTATLTINSQYVTISNVSFSGDTVYLNGYNLQDNTLTLNLTKIDVAGEFTLYVTVSGYDLGGNEISDTATVYLWGLDGYYVLNPGGWRENKDSGYATFTLNDFGIQPNTTTITVDQNWASIGTDPFSGQQAIVYSAYSGIPTNWNSSRKCTLTVTGTDYKGNTITVTRELIQYAVDAEMTINPTSGTIDYDGYIDVEVTLVGAAPIPTVIVNNNETYTWLNEWGDSISRSNILRITPPINTSIDPRSFTVTLKCEPLYGGSTIWRYVGITQRGKPVTITLTPATITVNKDAGTIIYDVAVDGISQSSLSRTWSATHSGMISSATFNADKTKLTVVYTANPLVANRVATISAYSDELSKRIYGRATITQTGVDPVLSAYDIAIPYNQTSSTNFITTKGVDNLSVTFNGDVNITGHRFVSTSGGYNLIIETPVNNTTNNYNSVATVTGTVTEGQYEGETRTATFNVIKYGIESVTITPSSRTLDYGQNTTTYTVNSINVNNLQVSTSGDSSFIVTKSLANGILTVTTSDYSAQVAKTATITVSGTGYTGTISASATLTKYGPDGTIVANPDSITFPKSAFTKQVSVTANGIASLIDVSYTGTISPSNIALNNSTLSISLNTNTTDGDLTGVITLTGTDYKGNVITETVNVIQKPYDSLIQLDPSSKTVNKAAGSTTYTLITDSIDSSTIRVSYSGPSITNATRNGDTITVTYRENPVVATRNNTVTVTATDIYGTSISATADLFQTGIDPTMTASNVNILSTQSNATSFVSTNGIGLPATVVFNGEVNVTDYTVSSTSGGFNINIVTADNLTNSLLRSTATVTATVTEGQYTGETRTATFNITKFGLEGIITIDPEELTVKKAGQIVVFDVSLGNMQNDTVTASTGTFNQDKSQLTVTVGQNTSSSDRTINVVVSGTDTNGNTKSATAVINQYGIDPYIAITPSSRTLRFDVSNTSYSVTAYKVSNLSVNIEGGVTIVDYDLTGSTLSIITADNEEQFSVMSIITITGTSENGETITATATLSKFGKGGGILVDSDYTIPSNAGTLVIPYDLDQVDPDSIVAIAEGDIEITRVYVNREDRVIVIDYNANDSNSPINGRITVTGMGEDELPKYSIIDLTQLGNDIELIINPTYNTLSYTATSSSATVTATGVSRTNMSYSGSIEPSSCTFNKNASEGGTISATFPENSTNVRKFLYTTVTGYDHTGTIVTSSAVVEQGSDPSTGPYVFMFQPASQVIKVIEASANNVYYSVSSYKGNASVGYNITGFILTGKWGAKPSVAHSNGYPYVKIPLNTHPAERETLVVFVQNGSYNTLTSRIIQQEGVEPDVTPIWKEFVNSDTADSFIEYHINLDGDIIYAGKAYKYPDSSKITWSINDAVSNYLGNGIQFTEGIHQIPDYAKDFYMETNTDKKYIETFYNSWAYEDTDYWLSDPIDYRVDQRQWLPVSFLSTNYDQITVNGRVYAALKENDGWTVMTKLGKYIVDCNAGISVMGADGSRLNYKIASGDYVLYYSNAYGGWDSLLCNGTSRKTDNIEHLNYRRKSANQSQFSKINYQNNITPTWSLNTGINIDGSKMYHLLESTMVYLHNLETNEIIPVVITNSSCDYLNYTNNGKKPYYYTITVEESNQKLRK